MGNYSEPTSKRGWFWSFALFLFGFLIVTLGASISLLWIYTNGNLDEKSIEAALPVIKRDIDHTALVLGKKFGEAKEWLDPYLSQARIMSQSAWKELERRNRIVVTWVNRNCGPYFLSMKKGLLEYWNLVGKRVEEGWNNWLKPGLGVLLAKFRPLGEFIVERSILAWNFIEKDIYPKASELAQGLQKSFNKLTTP